jgi:hypothetical protein
VVKGFFFNGVKGKGCNVSIEGYLAFSPTAKPDLAVANRAVTQYTELGAKFALNSTFISFK